MIDPELMINQVTLHRMDIYLIIDAGQTVFYINKFRAVSRIRRADLKLIKLDFSPTGSHVRKSRLLCFKSGESSSF